MSLKYRKSVKVAKLAPVAHNIAKVTEVISCQNLAGTWGFVQYDPERKIECAQGFE